jgi:hypothetical protein
MAPMKNMFGAAGSILMAVTLVTGCGSKGGGYHPVDGGPDGGGDAASCPTGGTGQLVLEMIGLPAGVTPMVRVSGGATPMLLMAGTPVTVNAGGGYVIETRRVKTVPTAPSVIGKAYQATTTFDGCVKPDTTTTAMVTFVAEPGSDKLWATAVNPEPPHADGVVAAFAGADLAATAAKNPTVWLSKNTTGRGGGGAFDFYGNFWLPAGDVINRYDAATLGASNDTVPGAKLMQPTTAAANFVAFDADGNLWASRGAPAAEKSIVRYPATATGISATSDVAITFPANGNPRALAFDAAGNLWVSDDERDQVLKFAAGRLGASSSAAADVTITTKTPVGAPIQGPYTDPNPLAFDKLGNLWIGYDANVVKLTPAQQTASADLAGPFSINVPGGTGMFAFDESGGLWMSETGGKLKRIPAAMLAGAGGDVTPDIVVTSSEVSGGTENVVINPAPTWSVIHDAL